MAESKLEIMHDKNAVWRTCAGKYGAPVGKNLREYSDARHPTLLQQNADATITEIRINFAKKQLEMTNYSVTDIAYSRHSSPFVY